jgi:hypothetical protein
MRPRLSLENLGSVLVVLSTVSTIAILGVAGSFKTASADLIAQVAELRDPSKPAPNGLIDQQLIAALAPDIAPGDIPGRDARAQLLDHRSDRLLEATAVVALVGMLFGLVAARPASEATYARDAGTQVASTNGTR